MRGEYIHTRRTYSIFKCGTISWQPYIPLEYSILIVKPCDQNISLYQSYIYDN